MHAFILAGGFATRLWPLTEQRAKPLLPLAGTPILTHIVKQLPADMDVTVSTNASFAESFEQWRSGLGQSNIRIRIEHTRSDDEKLGTLGATAQWIEEENIDDAILLLTGDNYFGFDMNTFIDQFEGNAIVAAYDIGERSKAAAFGTIVLAPDGRTVAEFEEKPRDPRSSLVSTGCSVLPASALPDLLAYARIKPDNVGGIFEELLRLGRTVDVFTFTEPWFDIGSFEAYLAATNALVGSAVLQAPTAVLTDCRCTGSVVLGEQSKVTHSELTDTVIFGNCIIEDCILEHCVIDDGCILKGIDLRGKMLRAGTRLERP